MLYLEIVTFVIKKQIKTRRTYIYRKCVLPFRLKFYTELSARNNFSLNSSMCNLLTSGLPF